MFLRKATQRQKQYEKNMIKSMRKNLKKIKIEQLKISGTFLNKVMIVVNR